VLTANIFYFIMAYFIFYISHSEENKEINKRPKLVDSH